MIQQSSNLMQWLILDVIELKWPQILSLSFHYEESLFPSPWNLGQTCNCSDNRLQQKQRQYPFPGKVFGLDLSFQLRTFSLCSWIPTCILRNSGYTLKWLMTTWRKVLVKWDIILCIPLSSLHLNAAMSELSSCHVHQTEKSVELA